MADLSLTVHDLHLFLVPLLLDLVSLLFQEALRFERLVLDFHDLLVMLDGLLVELVPQRGHRLLLLGHARICVLELEADLVHRLEKLVRLLLLRADLPAEPVVLALEVQYLLKLFMPFFGLGCGEISKLEAKPYLLVLDLKSGTA